ncbi:AMP-binding protein [Mycobacterium sp. CBMA271]|uniref:fatty acyl-AMP ligase n=1 Tax=unclassified Mycobacteroides TaxID=2618759 RepID=UPI0013274522|nr:MULTISPECIES: fatty acyl-AMP ligase [unclassified Mycobacteroides]MUM16267.1 fatty-acid--CoA ligase [Mycobacteroides sp. CBMA 326]MUM22228.1 AMP-binding protein [Mycobacteroides sp. CBMA 271]
MVRGDGLLDIDDCLDAQGNIALPPGTTMISLIERNIRNVGDTVAYRYLDFTTSEDGTRIELTWAQLGVRLNAVAAEIQRHIGRGDRVAILAPQGLDYVVGFFSAIKAGAIAVPLFAPELPGHAERLDTALRDCTPTVVLTTAAVRDAVQQFLDGQPESPRILVIEEIPDEAGETFEYVHLVEEDVSHLQYTSGATRPPVGIEITHRAVGVNLMQMILSIDLLDRNTHGCSWLPLYHDMGLSMIGFPTVYGGHSTLMSPTAFIRRPLRWIKALSDGCKEGRVITAAPNFAYEYTAQRGVPEDGADIDLGKVVMIIGSEPVSIDAIRAVEKAFAPFGLPPTAFKPSYGIAEATLFISNIAPDAEPSVVYLDRDELAAGRAVSMPAGTAHASSHVSCGQLARSLHGVIVDSATGDELQDGRVGEIWLQGNNVGRGYWNRPEDTAKAFHARLGRMLAHSHAAKADATGDWLRTGDMGCYLDGELYVTGRLVDHITIDRRSHYPQDIEATVADASPVVRRGYVTAFTVPNGLVIVAERASRTAKADPQEAIDAITVAVAVEYGLDLCDVRLLPAGAIPRTTSGKLARRACRRQYLDGTLGVH